MEIVLDHTRYLNVPFSMACARLSLTLCIDRFLGQFTERVDLNTRAYFAWVYTARWLGFRMDMVVIMVLIASCFFSVAVNEYSDSVGESWIRMMFTASAGTSVGARYLLACQTDLILTQAHDGRSLRTCSLLTWYFCRHG